MKRLAVRQQQWLQLHVQVRRSDNHGLHQCVCLQLVGLAGPAMSPWRLSHHSSSYTACAACAD